MIEKHEPRSRLLSIDDDPEISNVLRLRLAPYRVQVTRASNATQGFLRGITTRPDAIILDMMMPQGDGCYVFGRLRTHPCTLMVPVIVLSGQRNTAVKRHMIGIGAAAYLYKPLNLDELLHELRNFLPLSRPAPPREDAHCLKFNESGVATS